MPSSATLRDGLSSTKGWQRSWWGFQGSTKLHFHGKRRLGHLSFMVCMCCGCLISTSNWLCVCACFGQDYRARAMGFSWRRLFQGVWDLMEMEGTSFAMVKLSMSDGILSQPPLCVYPQSLLQSTESFFNCLNSTTSILTQSLDETRAADLNELASVIEVDYPHMGRSREVLKANHQRWSAACTLQAVGIYFRGASSKCWGWKCTVRASCACAQTPQAQGRFPSSSMMARQVWWILA